MTQRSRPICVLCCAVLTLHGCGASSPAPDRAAAVGGRQVYSPDISGDPYIRAEWEKSIRLLEEQCTATGEYCSEAAQARQSLRKRGRSGL